MSKEVEPSQQFCVIFQVQLNVMTFLFIPLLKNRSTHFFGTNAEFLRIPRAHILKI